MVAILSSDTPIVEPTPAREVYTDGFSGLSLAGGIVKIPFLSTTQLSEQDAYERRIVMRLAAPVGVVAELHEALGRLMIEMARMAAVEAEGEPARAN